MQGQHDVPDVAKAVCNHSAFVSPVVHSAERRKLEQRHVTAVQTCSQAQQPNTAADKQDFHSTQRTSMLDIIQQHYAQDPQCGSPDSGKIWPHMYADHGIWRHHSGSIVVPHDPALKKEIIAKHDSLYAGHTRVRRTPASQEVLLVANTGC